MDYLLLGTMTATAGDRTLNLGGYRQRAVLAALLLAADRTLDVDTLTEQVWDGSPPPKPVVSLRAYVANLRRILADDARTDRLVTDGHGYRLQLGADRLDTRQFETQTGLGKRLLDNGDPTRAATVLDGALALWRGSPLSDLRDLQFTYHEIHRFEALRSDAVEARYEAELLRGRSTELIGGLESEVATNPLRERLWAQLMLAMYRAGRRTDALAAYHRLEVILADELGVRPGLALERLAAQIRDESADLHWTAPPDRIPVSRPTSRPLFGRIPELTRLHDALTDAADRRGGIAVVTGDSGVGKTALATEVARLADELGMTSIWVGHPGGVRTPPSWAWSQVLRTLANHHGNTLLTPTVPTGESESFSTGTDFAHLEEMVGAVAEQCGHHPTVIVLDDLHRADRSTRDVLELLSSFVNRMPLLVLATWQDAGMHRPMYEPEFDQLLSRCEVTLIRLRGLGNDATAQLIEKVSGLTPTPEFVESVGTRTGGNAFHIKELTRLLCDTGQLDENTTAIAIQDVPDAVSGVIRSRMAGVPARHGPRSWWARCSEPNSLPPSPRSCCTWIRPRWRVIWTPRCARVSSRPATPDASGSATVWSVTPSPRRSPGSPARSCTPTSPGPTPPGTASRSRSPSPRPTTPGGPAPSSSRRSRSICWTAPWPRRGSGRATATSPS